MKEDIEEELKRKYDEIVVPDRIFDTTKIIQRVQEERRKRKLKIQRTVACVVTLILVVSLAVVGVSLKINYDKTKNIDNNMGATENNENIENEIPEVSGSIVYNNTKFYGKNTSCDYVYVAEVKEILNYEIIDDVPSTRLKAHVVENFGENVEGDVEMIVPGGVFTVKEIKKISNIEENEEIENYKDEEKVNVTCYNEIYIPMAEIGKTYLTSVREDENGLYVCGDLSYGFKEYDIENNTIKDIDGNSVEVELDKYLEKHKENK